MAPTESARPVVKEPKRNALYWACQLHWHSKDVSLEERRGIRLEAAMKAGQHEWRKRDEEALANALGGWGSTARIESALLPTLTMAELMAKVRGYKKERNNYTLRHLLYWFDLQESRDYEVPRRIIDMKYF